MKRLLIALALAGLPWLANGYSFSQQPAGGEYVSKLQADFHVFNDALHNRLEEADAGTVRTSRKAMEKLRIEIRKMTLANFEYTYMENGVEKTLVVHGRSGKPLETILDDAKYTAMSGGATSESSATGTSDGGGTETGRTDRKKYELSPEEVERDIADARWFPADTFGQRGITYADVRAPRIPAEESQFKLVITPGTADHSNDAELMNLRYYEREIEAGRLPPGGKLKGIVSKTLCQSCETNMRLFAERYDIDVDMRYLVEPGASGLPFDPSSASATITEQQISLSRVASAELKEARDAASNSLRSKNTWSRRPLRHWTSTPHDEAAVAEQAALEAELCE